MVKSFSFSFLFINFFNTFNSKFVILNRSWLSNFNLNLIITTTQCLIFKIISIIHIIWYFLANYQIKYATDHLLLQQIGACISWKFCKNYKYSKELVHNLYLCLSFINLTKHIDALINKAYTTAVIFKILIIKLLFSLANYF